MSTHLFVHELEAPSSKYSLSPDPNLDMIFQTMNFSNESCIIKDIRDYLLCKQLSECTKIEMKIKNFYGEHAPLAYEPVTVTVIHLGVDSKL